MVKVYELSTATDEHDEITDMNDDLMVESIIKNIEAGRHIKEEWQPLEFILHKKRKKGEALHWFPGIPVVTGKCKDALSDLIKDSVEILPAKFMGARYKELYVINITNIIDAVDYNKSKCSYFSSGRLKYINDYYFIKGKIVSQHIFKVKEGEDIGVSVFVSEEFIQRMLEHHLVGFRYREVWDSEKGI